MRSNARTFVAVATRAICLLWLVSVLVFAVLRAIPGDPAIIGLIERNQAADAENIRSLQTEMGLHEPILVQYGTWAGSFLTGEWGQSLRTRRPVADEILGRLPWSAAVGGGGLVVASMAALVLGLLAALRPRGTVDRVTRALVIGTQAVPSFLVAIFLSWLLAVQLGGLRIYTGTMAERVVLPLLLVALYSLPALTRVVRMAFLLAGAQPYFQTARAKGRGQAAALIQHAGRPALLALLAVLTSQASWAIGGTAVAEMVFAIPGVSQLVVESVASRDYAVLQAFVMLVACAMIVVHASAELGRNLLDPRPVSCVAS